MKSYVWLAFVAQVIFLLDRIALTKADIFRLTASSYPQDSPHITSGTLEGKIKINCIIDNSLFWYFNMTGKKLSTLVVLGPKDQMLSNILVILDPLKYNLVSKGLPKLIQVYKALKKSSDP